MTKKNDDGGYLLPEEPDGERICVTIPVPNIPEHRQAFFGAIEELTHWYKWQRDPTKKARLVAAVWRRIADSVAAQLDLQEICDMGTLDVRQNSENPCILEKTDDGITWVPFADISLCMPKLRRNPATGVYQWGTEDIGFYDFPDGPYVPNSPETPTVTPPAREEETTEDRICAAATNAANLLRLTSNGISSRLGEELISAGSLEIAAEIGAFLAGVFSAVGLLEVQPYIGLASAIILAGIGADFNLNPLDDEDEDRLKCLLIDNATDTDGVVTFDFNGFYFAIDLENPKQTTTREMLTILGADALNFMGTQSVLEGDCEDCPSCVYEDYFTSGIGPHTYLNGEISFLPQTQGQWVSSGGRTGGGYAGPEGNGTHEVINCVIDLGMECIVDSVTAWLYLTTNAGTYLEIWIETYDDGGALVHTGLYQTITTLNTWIQVTATGSATLVRYVRLYTSDLGGSVYRLDDIEVNH